MITKRLSEELDFDKVIPLAQKTSEKAINMEESIEKSQIIDNYSDMLDSLDSRRHYNAVS